MCWSYNLFFLTSSLHWRDIALWALPLISSFHGFSLFFGNREALHVSGKEHDYIPVLIVSLIVNVFSNSSHTTLFLVAWIECTNIFSSEVSRESIILLYSLIICLFLLVVMFVLLGLELENSFSQSFPIFYFYFNLSFYTIIFSPIRCVNTLCS